MDSRQEYRPTDGEQATRGCFKTLELEEEELKLCTVKKKRVRTCYPGPIWRILVSSATILRASQ
jgi:hypothetical protein